MGRNCGDALGRWRQVKLPDTPYKMKRSKKGTKE
jgi:hypothetical protein